MSGRNQKSGVDYFPHYTSKNITSPTIFTLEQSFGNDGYALWFKLLEYLGTRPDLCLHKDDLKEWKYFVARAKVDEEKAIAILDLLSEVDAIDKELWESGIVWTENFAENTELVYKKRGVPRPAKPAIGVKKAVEQTAPQPEPQEEAGTGKEKKPKKRYAEKVMMTEEQYGKLVAQLGEQGTLKCIEYLSNYKVAKGATYKEDYRAILNWCVDKLKKEHPEMVKPGTEKGKAVSSGNPFATDW